jgi:uncharacterized protein (DUF1778 family)
MVNFEDCKEYKRAFIRIRIEISKKEQLKMYADMENRNLSNFILNAVDEYCNRHYEKEGR